VFAGICYRYFSKKKGMAMEVAMPKPPKEDGGVFQCLINQTDSRTKISSKTFQSFMSSLTVISIF
ncbi:MAG: hypothetical protein WBN45_15860, partial [Arenicellales bacterium]